MNVIYLERQLRAGRTPQSLGGKEIGRGVCKSAYLFNDGLVVKENAQNGFAATEEKTPPNWIKQYGARAPRTYKAGKYIIQELVTVLSKIPDYENTPAGKTWRVINEMARKHGGPYDMHQHNCGVDKNGQLVVFDW